MRFDLDFKFPKAGAMRKKTSLSARYKANFPDDKSMSYKKVVPDRGHPTMKTGLFVTSLRLVYVPLSHQRLPYKLFFGGGGFQILAPSTPFSKGTRTICPKD